MKDIGHIAPALRRARKRLSKPGAWIKGQFGLTAYGEPTLGYSGDSVCWCAVGALRAEGVGAAQVDAVSRLLFGGKASSASLTTFNDSQDTVGPVLALFDKAIAKLEAKDAP